VTKTVQTPDPVEDSDMELIITLVRDPTVTTGEATRMLGLPDVPDDEPEDKQGGTSNGRDGN
jgi:hypothetical protein